MTIKPSFASQRTCLPREESNGRIEVTQKLLQTYGGLQWQFVRRATDKYGVIAGDQGPRIPRVIKDRQILGVDLDFDDLLFSSLEFNFAETDEALGGLIGTGRQSCIDFGDL